MVGPAHSWCQCGQLSDCDYVVTAWSSKERLDSTGYLRRRPGALDPQAKLEFARVEYRRRDRFI